MRNVIIAPEYRTIELPIIFLAGPIQGAPDWQRTAIGILDDGSATIASPRRFIAPQGDFGEPEYQEQVEWEHFHLAYAAAHRGVTLFWLAAEAVHTCSRAYAQTTRFELGEAVTLHRLTGAKVVVGIEEGFSNARYIRATIGRKAPGIPLCASLDDTCRAAQRLLALP